MATIFGALWWPDGSDIWAAKKFGDTWLDTLNRPSLSYILQYLWFFHDLKASNSFFLKAFPSMNNGSLLLPLKSKIHFPSNTCTAELQTIVPLKWGDSNNPIQNASTQFQSIISWDPIYQLNAILEELVCYRRGKRQKQKGNIRAMEHAFSWLTTLQLLLKSWLSNENSCMSDTIKAAPWLDPLATYHLALPHCFAWSRLGIGWHDPCAD